MIHVALCIEVAAAVSEKPHVVITLHIGWPLLLHSDRGAGLKDVGSGPAATAKFRRGRDTPSLSDMGLHGFGTFIVFSGLLLRRLSRRDWSFTAGRCVWSLSILAQIADIGVLVLQQVRIFERVRRVGHFLVRFRCDLAPVVGWFVVHKETMLLKGVEGGSQLSVSLEYLAEEVTRYLINPFLIQLKLASQNLFLNLLRIILFHEGQRT